MVARPTRCTAGPLGRHTGHPSAGTAAPPAPGGTWCCARCGAVPPLDARPRWFVVRHGETDWSRENRYLGHAPTPLNETGRRQAQKAGMLLRGRGVGLIVSSDIARARHTAEIIAGELAVEIVLDARLRERALGAWEGVTREEVKRRYRATRIDRFDRRYRMPGGETREELERRVLAALTEYGRRYGDDSIVIVCHAGPIAAIQAALGAGAIGAAAACGYGGVYAIAPPGAARCGCGRGLWSLRAETGAPPGSSRP